MSDFFGKSSGAPPSWGGNPDAGKAWAERAAETVAVGGAEGAAGAPKAKELADSTKKPSSAWGNVDSKATTTSSAGGGAAFGWGSATTSNPALAAPGAASSWGSTAAFGSAAAATVAKPGAGAFQTSTAATTAASPFAGFSAAFGSATTTAVGFSGFAAPAAAKPAPGFPPPKMQLTPEQAAQLSGATPESIAAFKHKPADPAAPDACNKALIKEGSGDPVGMPDEGDNRIRLHYTCMTLKGDVIDSSRKAPGKPKETDLRKIVPGWKKVVPEMRVGEHSIFTFGSALCYGEKGAGSIPPNTPLCFELEIISNGTAAAAAAAASAPAAAAIPAPVAAKTANPFGGVGGGASAWASGAATATGDVKPVMFAANIKNDLRPAASDNKNEPADAKPAASVWGGKPASDAFAGVGSAVDENKKPAVSSWGGTGAATTAAGTAAWGTKPDAGAAEAAKPTSGMWGSSAPSASSSKFTQRAGGAASIEDESAPGAPAAAVKPAPEAKPSAPFAGFGTATATPEQAAASTAAWGAPTRPATTAAPATTTFSAAAFGVKSSGDSNGSAGAGSTFSAAAFGTSTALTQTTTAAASTPAATVFAPPALPQRSAAAAPSAKAPLPVQLPDDVTSPAGFCAGITAAASVLRRADVAASSAFFAAELRKQVAALTKRSDSLRARQKQLAARVERARAANAAPERAWYDGQGQRSDQNRVSEIVAEQWSGAAGSETSGARVAERLRQLAGELQGVLPLLEEFVRDAAMRSGEQ